MTLPYYSGVQIFGNSIARGSSAQEGYSYAQQLCNWVGGPLENRAVGNTGVNDITQAGYTYSSYGSRQKLVVWDGALNDIRYHGQGAMNAIGPSLDAFLSAAFMGGARAANAQSVVKTGTWSGLTETYGGISFRLAGGPLSTVDPTASMSFSFTGPRVVVHSYLTSNPTIYRNFKISIDGSSPVPFEIEGKAIPGTITPAAKVFRGLSASPHTITITPFGPCVSVVDALVFPMPEGFAPVLIGHIPYLEDWTQGGSIATPELIDQANSIISSKVAEWAADGFPVEVVPVNDYYLPSRDHSDGIHPDTLGHRNYACAYISSVRLTDPV